MGTVTPVRGSSADRELRRRAMCTVNPDLLSIEGVVAPGVLPFEQLVERAERESE